jgi:hypothetical protein
MIIADSDAQGVILRQSKLDALRMKIGDKVIVMVEDNKWYSGKITSIATGFGTYVYDNPIIRVSGIRGNGEVLFTENDLELRGAHWWERV